MKNIYEPTSETKPPQPETDLNRLFGEALLDPDLDIPEGIGKNARPAPKRFSVYRNNVVVSLIEALKAAYPSLHTIIGEENFATVARVFISQHPPGSAMMQKFGGEFANFLSNFQPLRDSPFLADIARAERAWLDAWHAADHPPLTPEELGAIPADETTELVLQPLPATRLICSQYPVADLFDARNHWPQPDIDLSATQNLLITRPHLECLATLIDDATAGFLKALGAETSLGNAIVKCSEEDAGFDAGSTLGILLQTGALQTLRQDRLVEEQVR